MVKVVGVTVIAAVLVPLPLLAAPAVVVASRSMLPGIIAQGTVAAVGTTEGGDPDFNLPEK